MKYIKKSIDCLIYFSHYIFSNVSHNSKRLNVIPIIFILFQYSLDRFFLIIFIIIIIIIIFIDYHCMNIVV